MSELMNREEVAEYLGIDPESVRSTMRRYGITEQRGYPRDQVMSLQRKQPSRRAEQEATVSGVTWPEWQPEEPANSRVIEALTRRGVDDDFITAEPEGTWTVTEGNNPIVVSVDYDGNMNDTWYAAWVDGAAIAHGELNTVAAAVAAAIEAEGTEKP